jgi:hypothetical protein
VKKHEEGILRWFHSRMTNGLLEGINGLVQAAKRKVRGYRNVQNFQRPILGYSIAIQNTRKSIGGTERLMRDLNGKHTMLN